MSDATIAWARSVQPDLMKLQMEHNIPALFAAAQMCHESAGSSPRGLSGLAENANNFAGIKWSEWQRPYGCVPVTMSTWEVLDGQSEDVDDAFCKCPSWEVWLQVYAALLSFDRYKPAKAFAGDPLLYGRKVAQGGWATDPGYLLKIADWMEALYDIFQDATPAAQVAISVIPPEPIAVTYRGQKLCDGWVADDRTVVPVRQFAESLGYRVSWDQAARTVIVQQGS